jgi:hypothetical protein
LRFYGLQHAEHPQGIFPSTMSLHDDLLTFLNIFGVNYLLCFATEFCLLIDDLPFHRYISTTAFLALVGVAENLERIHTINCEFYESGFVWIVTR